MAGRFRDYDPHQAYLLPPSLQEWVGDGSLARFVDEAVDLLAARGRLKAFFEGYENQERGAAAFHPVMMLKILLLGYCSKMTSSRAIARGCREWVPLRFLAANQQPNFRAIAAFRARHIEAFRGLFVEVLCLARAAGLVRLGIVALDGRKIAGNAALSANRTREHLEQEVADLVKQSNEHDLQDDIRLGEQNDETELPEELTKSTSRRHRLLQALDQLQKERQDADSDSVKQNPSQHEGPQNEQSSRRVGRHKQIKSNTLKAKRANTTDPESRIMKSRRGYIQGYNGQAMVAVGSQVIVACDVTQDAHDSRQLSTMLNACHEQAGGTPSILLADAGYPSARAIDEARSSCEVLAPCHPRWKLPRGWHQSGFPRGRIPAGATPIELMQRELQTMRGKSLFKKRATTVEPVFGQMVMRDLNRFLLRGLHKVRAEWAIWCLTHNLLKLWRSGNFQGEAALA